MKYTIYLTPDKIPFLQKKFKEVTIGEISTTYGITQAVTFTINSGSDLLDLFHAGQDYGFHAAQNIYESKNQNS